MNEGRDESAQTAKGGISRSCSEKPVSVSSADEHSEIPERQNVPAGQVGEEDTQGQCEKKKKRVQKRWFIPLGRFNVYVLIPLFLVLIVAGVILKMLIVPIVSFLFVMVILAIGIPASKGEPIEEGNEPALYVIPILFAVLGFLLLDAGIIPWLHREHLLVEAASSESRVRANAADRFGKILALSYRLEDERIEAVLARMVEDPDSHVRKQAIESLWYNTNPNVTDKVIRALRDPVAEVRGSAAQCLGIIKDAKARSQLSVGAASESDAEARKWAQWALGKISKDVPHAGKPVAQGASKTGRTPAEWGYVWGTILGGLAGIIFMWRKFGLIAGILTTIGVLAAIGRMIA